MRTHGRRVLFPIVGIERVGDPEYSQIDAGSLRPKTELSITQNSANSRNPIAPAAGAFTATRVTTR